MDEIRRLALNDGWIYEAVVATYCEGVPHATPVGVWAAGAALQMDLYEGSRTLAAVLAGSPFVVGFPADAGVFFAALHAPDELEFGRAHAVEAPRLLGCGADVELTLGDAAPCADAVRITGRVERVERHGELRLINRAESLLLESLILASRLERSDDRAATLATLAGHRRVVHKVAPGSSHAAAMDRLLQGLGAG